MVTSQKPTMKKTTRKTTTLKKSPLSQSLKFLGYRVVHTWDDGMEEKAGFFEYKGKLWTNGDTVFIEKSIAEKYKKSGDVVVKNPRGSGYFILSRVK